MKYRKLRKALREEFIKRAIALILERSGVEKPDGLYDREYVLETNVGRMTAFVDENRTEGPGTVFCRFDEPERANKIGLGVSPYSGKWNHHYFGEYSVDDAIRNFEAMLACVYEEDEVAG